MSNPVRATEHGGFIVEGTISYGTLRQQDLLRAFATELGRLVPFGSQSLCSEAFALADTLDGSEIIHPYVPDGTANIYERASVMIDDLTEEINNTIAPYGYWFGTYEGDGAHFGIQPAIDDY